MKKYLLGIFALVLAIGFSAFTTKSANTDWFVYDEDATYYFVTSTDPLDCLSSGSIVCKISTTETPDEYNRVSIAGISEVLGRKN